MRGWAHDHDGAQVRMKRSPEGVFEGVAVFPTASAIAWCYMRRLLMLDGAHLSTEFGGILLLATGVDVDEATVVLAWAIVRVESIAT